MQTLKFVVRAASVSGSFYAAFIWLLGLENARIGWWWPTGDTWYLPWLTGYWDVPAASTLFVVLLWVYKRYDEIAKRLSPILSKEDLKYLIVLWYGVFTSFFFCVPFFNICITWGGCLPMTGIFFGYLASTLLLVVGSRTISLIDRCAVSPFWRWFWS